MVIFRSFGSSTVRADMMAGTEQPLPTMKGIKDFPERPNRLKTRSKKNEIRDMYPVVSKMERHKKRMISCGMKLQPAPTPATIPF